VMGIEMFVSGTKLIWKKPLPASAGPQS